MERQELEAAFHCATPRVWELIGPSTDRIPSHTRTLVERAINRLFEAVAECMTADGELSPDSVRELEALGLAISRMMSWDVVDDLNKAYVQTVIEAGERFDGADLGMMARAAISVSDHFYDGFWVYNNHEGFEQSLRLGALIDHFPIPTFMLDEFGVITFANNALCAAVGRSLSELDATKLEDLMISDAPILTAEESDVVIAIGSSENRHYRLSLTQIDTSEGTEFFGQLVDRTDEVRLERTKEQVIATISHELRTPLTAVVGYAELLNASELDPDDGPKVDRAEAMAVIYEQATHLLELVTDLVDFARLDTGRIGLRTSEVDLRSVLDSVARRVGVSAEIEIVLCVPHRTHIWGDRTRLEQLFTNLLTNALRYGGPKIVVEAWRTDASTIGVRFADNGAGIAVEDRAHVFETFYQGDQTHVGVGTGMGLAICKAIVRAHQGAITLEDRAGASFMMELPAAS